MKSNKISKETLAKYIELYIGDEIDDLNSSFFQIVESPIDTINFNKGDRFKVKNVAKHGGNISFHIDDETAKFFCLLKGCAFLDGDDWIIVK